VRVVGVRVQERDRERLDLLAGELVRHRRHRSLVEVAPHLSARAEPLRHLVPQPPRHERRRLVVLDVVEHRDAQPPHLQDVAEPLGRHERRPRAAALEDRVRRDRRRVHDVLDRRRRHARLVEQREDPVDDAPRVVAGRRQHLLRPHRAVASEQDDVGERSADVDADAVARPCPVLIAMSVQVRPPPVVLLRAAQQAE
jgi:hypothetical protein